MRKCPNRGSSPFEKCRRPINIFRGYAIRDQLASGLPSYAKSHLIAGLSGDINSALNLCVRAPNHWRGLIALAAFYLGTPNPGYQEIVRSVWNHDHTHFVNAAGGRPGLVRRMMKEGRFDHPHSGQLSIFRGVSWIGMSAATRGLSWTTSRDVACWFARRFANETHQQIVLTANIDSSEIVFYDNERSEHEVVLKHAVVGSVDCDQTTWTEAALRFEKRASAS